MMSRLSRAVLAAGFTALLGLGWAVAQTSAIPGGRSYVTPFPPNERYQAVVVGDGLAQGLASGLTEAFKADGAVRVAESTSYSFSIARSGFDWSAEIDRILAAQPAQIAVVMSGVNDARPIRTNEGSFRPGTPEWKEAYGRIVEKIIKKFKSSNVALYWVGLPVMGGSANNEAMEALNDVLREKTYLNGVRFVDTWSGFADQFGGYSAFGPDLTGQNKRLRENDGIYFTAVGNRKLAHYIEVVLRRDLAAARAERNIPLAGDETEQRRVAPRETDLAVNESGEPGSLATEIRDAMPGSGAAASAPRPAYDPAPAPLSPSAGLGGELIAGEIISGVTALASISPANDLSQKASLARVPVADRIYTKVLVKGEYLPPKAGRADDYAWPKASPDAEKK
ncbi:MAG: GDSL-type esterase/lipase family protein [Hyphomicrobiales bacterium]|nr:GDSL-type esterase/lipase family protein [Hyphomicrobiales bacterium]